MDERKTLNIENLGVVREWEMFKNGAEAAAEWIWKVCVKALKNGHVPDVWVKSVTVPL